MNRPRRIKPRVLLSISTIVTAFAVAFLALVIFVRKPYVEVTEVRTGVLPETVRVTSRIGCGEAYYAAADGRRYVPIVPSNGKDLQEGFEVFVSDNSFDL